MNLKNKVGFVCNAIVALQSLLFGIVYLVSDKFMPYHAEAIGRSWQALDGKLQILILAMMKAMGSGYLVSAAVAAVLLIIPWRRGEKWGRWTLFLVGLAVSSYSAGLALFVQIQTAAHTPWPAPVIGCVLLLIGFLLAPKASSQISPGIAEAPH